MSYQEIWSPPGLEDQWFLLRCEHKPVVCVWDAFPWSFDSLSGAFQLFHPLDHTPSNIVDRITSCSPQNVISIKGFIQRFMGTECNTEIHSYH